MISDSLTNNITVDTGNVYIPAEFGIFGENSAVYNSVSEISEAKTVNTGDYIVKSGVAVGLCIYFLLILLILKGRISGVCKMFADYRFAKKQYEETNRISVVNTSHIILFTIIVVSVQFSLMNNYQEYRLAIVPFLALTGVFTVQSAALKFVALICKSEDICGEVHLNRKLYFNVFGIIILPLTIVALLYSDTAVEQTVFATTKILSGILLLSMMIRILRVFSEARVSYFFRFLYLCVFEISPYLALFIVFENIN
jgi:hypothetical protein